MPKIRFHPHSQMTTEFSPEPKPGIRFVPEWYKAQPGSKNDEEFIPQGMSGSTVKRCMPVFDAMTAGYIMSAPCDIHLDATNPEELKWSIPLGVRAIMGDMFSRHAYEQYDHYPIDPSTHHKQLLRIMPFWSVETDEGYSTLFMNPHHTDASPLWAVSGLVDTDKFISEGHLSFLVRKDFKGIIKQGTPLIQVLPMRREDWESEIVDPVLSKAAFEKQRFNLRSTFMNGYKNKFRSKKEYK